MALLFSSLWLRLPQNNTRLVHVGEAGDCQRAIVFPVSSMHMQRAIVFFRICDTYPTPNGSNPPTCPWLQHSPSSPQPTRGFNMTRQQLAWLPRVLRLKCWLPHNVPSAPAAASSPTWHWPPTAATPPPPVPRPPVASTSTPWPPVASTLLLSGLHAAWLQQTPSGTQPVHGFNNQGPQPACLQLQLAVTSNMAWQQLTCLTHVLGPNCHLPHNAAPAPATAHPQHGAGHL